MVKCEWCRQAEASIALQFVASETPSKPLLGSHYRGFPVVKLCDACASATDDTLAKIHDEVLQKRAQRRGR